MATVAPNLDEKQVNGRLCSYESEAVTGELYQFGSMLVSEFVDRVHHLDSKGGVLAGYSTGVVALLVSTSSFWRPVLSQWAVVVVFVAGLCAIIASALSLKAASIFKFKWFSDDEWLQKST
jgi:hypothetical protein